MRAKMLTLACGPKGNFYPGQEVHGDIAAQFVAAGYAKPLDAVKKAAPIVAETATQEPAERATLRLGRKGK